MMRIAIVDDSEKWRNLACEQVEQNLDNQNLEIHKYSSGESFLEKDLVYDVVFVDIEMEGMDGFETAEKYGELHSESIIVILTTHTELSRKGYGVNAFRYIDKVNIRKEMKEALFSAQKLMGRNKAINLNVLNHGIRELVLKDILYFETVGRKVMVHTTTDIFECSNSIGTLESELEAEGFYRTHKSFLINLDAIKSIRYIGKTSIRLKDNSEVILSTRKYPEIRKKYADRTFEYANF